MGTFWHKQIIVKLYQGYSLAMIFVVKFRGVCFGYEFCMPKDTPGIFVRGGICLSVTPGRILDSGISGTKIVSVKNFNIQQYQFEGQIVVAQNPHLTHKLCTIILN